MARWRIFCQKIVFFHLEGPKRLEISTKILAGNLRTPTFLEKRSFRTLIFLEKNEQAYLRTPFFFREKRASLSSHPLFSREKWPAYLRTPYFLEKNGPAYLRTPFFLEKYGPAYVRTVFLFKRTAGAGRKAMKVQSCIFDTYSRCTCRCSKYLISIRSKIVASTERVSMC